MQCSPTGTYHVDFSFRNYLNQFSSLEEIIRQPTFRMTPFHHLLLLVPFLTYGQSQQSRCYNCTCTDNPPSQLVVNCSSLGLFLVPESLPHNLTTLDLSNNSIKYIPKRYFETFTDLSYLSISDNSYLGLKNASIAFFGLQNTSIKILHVSGVVRFNIGCVTMENDFFRYLKHTNLKKIYLDQNRILVIEPNTFISVPHTLQLLSLRRSRLDVTKVTCSQFLALKNLTTLDISHLNREAPLSDKMRGFDYFVSQVQGKNSTYDRKIAKRMISRPLIIPVPPKVEKLIAKDCNFEIGFEEGIEVTFLKNNLKVVNLRKNRMKKILGILRGIETLEELDLSENGCEQITSQFSQYMPKLKRLYLQGNNLGLQNNKLTDKPFEYLEILDLSSNRINEIARHALDGFPAMKKLILKNNLIFSFDVKIQHMSNLSVLDLSHNQITYLSRYIIDQLDAMSNMIPNLTLILTENPLLCSCNLIFSVRWVRSTSIIQQKQHLYCFFDNDRNKNASIISMGEDLEDKCTSHVGIAIGGLVAVTGSVIIIIVGLVHRFNWKLRYLYYIVRGKYRGNLVNQNRGEDDFHYDAFISYAEEDAEFAVNTFTKKLETDYQLRLCLHQRDFRPGETIASNILSAIQSSRRVVIVLSPSFLDSYWCRWEFEMARMESLYTERNMVVLVKYQEVLPSDVPRDMLYMMHTETYLEYPEGQQDQDTFWTALRQTIEDN